MFLCEQDEIVDRRGPEVEELQREINGLAKLAKLPVKFVNGVQLLYELQTLMPPVENASALIPAGYEPLANIPWRGILLLLLLLLLLLPE